MKESSDTDVDEVQQKQDCGLRLRKAIHKHALLIFLISLIFVAIIVGITLCVYWIPWKTQKVEKSQYEITTFRLPTFIIPKHYYLTLQPDLTPDKLTFNGSVNIVLGCIDETNVIIFHSRNLFIEEETIELRSQDEETIYEISEIKYNTDFDFVILKLLNYLPQGIYYLYMRFNGNLNKEPEGFHFSTYTENGVHYVAGTQFEPDHARSAFPCFDEPAMKATFDVTVLRWKNMTSLSNMPKLSTISRGDWDVDIFETSMKMSTFLLAVFVGKYVEINDGGRIRIWTPPNETENALYALEYAPKALNYFENILGIPYLLPKLDMVPLNWDKNRAMENWGLILFDKPLLMFEETKIDIPIQTDPIVATITHEIAHQWFGNLVTPKWWNDIWLSEGITFYMQQYAVAALYPEENKIDFMLLQAPGIIMDDCGASERTVGIYMQNITDLEMLFDEYTYMKGAIITRMVFYILGNNTFWRGMSFYLIANAFGNTEENDLWEHLSKAQVSLQPINLTEVMKSWIHLPGQPVVSVKRNFDGTVSLTQISCKGMEAKEHENDLWYIPIFYTTPQTIVQSAPELIWMSSRNTTVRLNQLNREEWLLINSHNLYFIVNYDRANWILLAEQLQRNNSVFTVDQRFKIFTDLWYLLELEYIDCDIILDIYLYIPFENELEILEKPTFVPLENYIRMMEANDHVLQWNEFIISILGPLYDKLDKDISFENSKLHIWNLHEFLSIELCKIGYESCIKDALKKYSSWRQRKLGSESFNIDETTLCIGVQYGSNQDWENLLQLFIENKLRTIAQALTCSEEETKIQKLLNLLKEGDLKSNFVTVFNGIYENNKFWIKLCEFLDENFLEILNNQTLYPWLMNTIEYIPANNPVKYEKLVSILRKYVGQNRRWSEARFNSVIDNSYKENISRMKLKTEKITSWLNKKQPSLNFKINL